MTVPGHDAAARRERLLRRTRTITLGIAGGAAVASLGLGTALAHVTPGHDGPAAPRAATAGHPAAPHATSPEGTSPRGTSGPATSGHGGPAGSAPAPARVPHHRHRLAPPPAPPASAPAAPHASSGGS
jgi:hypothetical protein